MRTKLTRGDFRSEEQWKEWQKDCRAEQQKAATERMERLFRKNELLLKHDISLVGRIIVIPKELVHLRLKKADFAHQL